MRKYRGKTKDGKWVEGWYCEWQNRAFIAPQPYDCGFNGGETISYHMAGWFEVIPASVGQSTGLKDKNGVEIYEGDNFKVAKNNTRGPVIFEKGCFGYHDLTDAFIPLAIKNGNYSGNTSDIEVIGNTTDTPELLEG